MSKIDRALTTIAVLLGLVYGSLILWLVSTGRDTYDAALRKSQQITIAQAERNFQAIQRTRTVQIVQCRVLMDIARHIGVAVPPGDPCL